MSDQIGPKPKMARVRKVENNKVWLDYSLGWCDIAKLEIYDTTTRPD